MSVQAAAPGREQSGTAHTLTEQLANFLADTSASDVPSSVLEQAQLYVLDWLGCALAGLQSEPGRIVLAHTREQPEGGCAALGIEGGRSSQVAALHNGAISHIVEMDDVDRASVIHPGAVVIPAALAVAQAHRRSGEELLAAIALGYEVAVRVGSAVGGAHYVHWHNTATCGVFGAAAAAGWLLRLSRDQMVWALGSAGTQAGGLWEFLADGAMSKHLHTGHAAASGALAAELAALGFTGARAILEGRRGFFAAACPDANPEAVVRDLAPGMAEYKLPRVSLKPYPSCRHTHAAVDAALRLRERLGNGVDKVEQVTVEGYQAMLDLVDNSAPTHGYAAKFSAQYCVSRALLDGGLRLEDFEPSRLVEPDVRALMARTRVRLADDLAARYPGQFPARVTVDLRDEQRLTEEVLDPRGDPENPLGPAEVEAKFRSLLDGTPWKAQAAGLVEAVRGLGSLSAVEAEWPAPLTSSAGS